MDDMQRQDNVEEPTKLDRLNLIGHWNNPLVVLMPKEDDFFINGVMEAYVSAESFEERLRSIPEDMKMAYSQIPVIAAVDMVCKTPCMGMWLHGFPEGDVYLSRAELDPIKEIAEMIITLQVAQATAMEQQTAPEEFNDVEFYILGELPNVLVRQDDMYNFDTIRPDDSGLEYLKMYVSKESAEHYNVRNFEIHSYTFRQLRDFCRGRLGMAIEPQQSFGVVFAPFHM